MLYSAFVTDGFLAHEQFFECCLCPWESIDIYLVELQRLSVLFGGMSDSGMMCAFMQGLPDKVKCLLCALNRMVDLSIDQLLACVWVIMKDEVVEEGMAVAAVQTTQYKMRELPYCPISYHQCNSPNHFAIDCKEQHNGIWKPQKRCFWVWHGWPYIPQLFGKWARGMGLSASLLPKPHMKVTLPAIAVLINGIFLNSF